MRKLIALPLSKRFAYALSSVLVAAHLCFYYLYAIDLKGVAFSYAYFALVVILPGFFISLLWLRYLSVRRTEPVERYFLFSLSAVLGIFNVLFFYLLSHLTGIFALNYVCLWPYALAMVKPLWSMVRSFDLFATAGGQKKYGTAPMLLLFALIFNLYFFAMRPTPGLVTVEIFHDHLWNAGNTVALMDNFPLHSLRIASMPYLSYHILVHILGAHMALLTGLTPHLVGLQYVFIPLVPLLVFSMIALMRQFIPHDNAYLTYGLAVLLFGGGFHIVHEVKVLNLLGSTNFFGVILLFMFLTIVVHLKLFNNTGRFLIVLIGLFLATVAKGTIGIALCGGVGLWWLYQIVKKRFDRGDFADMAGAAVGFLSSYYLFFVWPVRGQHFHNVVVEKGALPILPLRYVTNNELLNGYVQLIQNYLSGGSQIVALILLTLLSLPVYVLLYYSYRLLVRYYFKSYPIDDVKKKIWVFAISSLLVGYLLNVPYPQNSAYFITVSVFCLDVLFVLCLHDERVFTKIGEVFRARNLFSSIGITVILILPFVDVPHVIRHEHTHNYFFAGRVGQRLNTKLKNTSYRKTQQQITPEMYAGLSYIRKHTPKDSIVVSPLIKTPDGRPRAFYASTFSERTAFVEGYFQVRGLAKYADPEEVKQKLAIVDKIFNNHEIPAGMQDARHILFCKTESIESFGKKYPMKVLYKNKAWAVMQFERL